MDDDKGVDPTVAVDAVVVGGVDRGLVIEGGPPPGGCNTLANPKADLAWN